MEGGSINRRLSLVTNVVVVGAAWFAFSASKSVAQCVADSAVIPGWASVVSIPGLGDVDLCSLPPDIRKNIRIPGVRYEEPTEQPGDHRPVPLTDDFDSIPP